MRTCSQQLRITVTKIRLRVTFQQPSEDCRVWLTRTFQWVWHCTKLDDNGDLSFLEATLRDARRLSVCVYYYFCSAGLLKTFWINFHKIWERGSNPLYFGSGLRRFDGSERLLFLLQRTQPKLVKKPERYCYILWLA